MSIFKIFLKLNGLNCEEVNEIETYFIPFYIKKGKYLLKYNNICDHIAFIEEGAVQHCIFREGQNRHQVPFLEFGTTGCLLLIRKAFDTPFFADLNGKGFA